MTPTHTRKPVNVRAFVFNGHIDCLDQDHVNAKLIKCDNTFDDCVHCEHPIESHAYINTLSGEAIVCPGDYVINDPQFRDDYYPCKPDIFNETYDDMKDEEDETYSNSSNDISQGNIKIISLKLHAAELLLNNERHEGATKVAVNFMKQLIEGTSRLEPVNDGISFGEVMALINENNGILISRKAYDIDYIYFNSETDQFESYKNGTKTLHSFNTKDYTANDWYIVN